MHYYLQRSNKNLQDCNSIKGTDHVTLTGSCHTNELGPNSNGHNFDRMGSDFFLETFQPDTSGYNINFSHIQQDFNSNRQSNSWYPSSVGLESLKSSHFIESMPRSTIEQCERHRIEKEQSSAVERSTIMKSSRNYLRNIQESLGSVEENESCKKRSRPKKAGRPSGTRSVVGPSLTVAASTNAEKRIKIKNMFRKVAAVDLCTDVVNSSRGDPETKFVLIQVSTAPEPPLVGGAIPRNVIAEKVTTVTVYGGPKDDDLLRTMKHATEALSGNRPDTYVLHKVHSVNDVDNHFSSLENDRKMSQQQLQKRAETHEGSVKRGG